MYIIYYVLYIIHYILYILNYILYIKYYILYIIYYIIYIYIIYLTSNTTWVCMIAATLGKDKPPADLGLQDVQTTPCGMQLTKK